MDPEIKIRQESTGAMRSSDIDKERWDLFSGVAIRGLDTVKRVDLSQRLPADLIHMSMNYMWRFLAFDTNEVNYNDNIDWPMSSDSYNRMAMLYRGWWCLAIAIQKLDDICQDIRHDEVPHALPYHAFRRLSRACAEGVVKYGEENWHNGFRTKEVGNHVISHLTKWTNGFRDEDDLGHAMWNYMVAAHNMLVRPELCDLMLGSSYTITDELREYHDKMRAERIKAAEESNCPRKYSKKMPDKLVNEEFI